jgi:hypothetical protein
VSTMTLYGGPSAELCLKNSAEDVASTCLIFGSSVRFFFFFPSFLSLREERPR